MRSLTSAGLIAVSILATLALLPEPEQPGFLTPAELRSDAELYRELGYQPPLAFAGFAERARGLALPGVVFSISWDGLSDSGWVAGATWWARCWGGIDSKTGFDWGASHENAPYSGQCNWLISVLDGTDHPTCTPPESTDCPDDYADATYVNEGGARGVVYESAAYQDSPNNGSNITRVEYKMAPPAGVGEIGGLSWWHKFVDWGTCPAAPSVGWHILAENKEGGGDNGRIVLSVDRGEGGANRRLRLRFQTTVIGNIVWEEFSDPSEVPALGQWVRIQFAWRRHPTAGRAIVRIDGQTIFDVTGQTAVDLANEISEFDVGSTYTNCGGTTERRDDLVVRASVG